MHVRAKDVPQIFVTPLADQVQVDLTERRQPPVRVVDGEGLLAVGDLDAVVVGRPIDQCAEDARVVQAPHRRTRTIALHDGHRGRLRSQRADHRAAPDGGMGTEYAMRIVVRAADQAVEGFRVDQHRIYRRGRRRRGSGRGGARARRR